MPPFTAATRVSRMHPRRSHRAAPPHLRRPHFPAGRDIRFYDSRSGWRPVQESLITFLNLPYVPLDLSGGGFDGQGLSEEVMKKSLKTTICLDDDENEEDPKICAVCLDSLCQENQTIGILKCGHEYHESCIRVWLRRKNLCPLCKAIAF